VYIYNSTCTEYVVNSFIHSFILIQAARLIKQQTRAVTWKHRQT